MIRAYSVKEEGELQEIDFSDLFKLDSGEKSELEELWSMPSVKEEWVFGYCTKSVNRSDVHLGGGGHQDRYFKAMDLSG